MRKGSPFSTNDLRDLQRCQQTLALPARSPSAAPQGPRKEPRSSRGLSLPFRLTPPHGLSHL